MTGMTHELLRKFLKMKATVYKTTQHTVHAWVHDKVDLPAGILVHKFGGCYLKICSPVAKQTRERWAEANQEMFDPLQQNWEVRLVENVARYRKITVHTVTHNIWWSLSIDQPSNSCSWLEEANNTAAVICSCHGNNYVFTLMAKFLRIVALFSIADHAGMFFSSVHLL